MAFSNLPLKLYTKTALSYQLSFWRSKYNLFQLQQQQLCFQKIQIISSKTSSFITSQRHYSTTSTLQEEATAKLNTTPPSFQSLGVTPSLCRALKHEGIIVPTLIQCEALPFTFDHSSNCIIQSETGTGKTLTFLLPALQDQVPGLTTLVVVPTRELAIQIQYQVRKLVRRDTKRAKRVLAMYSGIDDSDIVALYKEKRPNILIATPKRLLQLLETNSKDFTSLRRLVLDEVDKLMLLPKKKANLKKKLMRDNVHPRAAALIVPKLLALQQRFRVQLIAASATVEEHLREELIELGWTEDFEMIATSESNRELISPDTIEHLCLSSDLSNTTADSKDFVKGDTLRQERDKIDILLEHFRSNEEKSALVFIHRNAPINQFVYDLKKRGLKAAALHENVNTPLQYAEFVDNFKNGDIELVVCTEETVRGLDFMWLNTVYLLMVPKTAKDYLHLCGRVGRAWQRGRAVMIAEEEVERKRMRAHYQRLGVEVVERTSYRTVIAN